MPLNAQSGTISVTAYKDDEVIMISEGNPLKRTKTVTVTDETMIDDIRTVIIGTH